MRERMGTGYCYRRGEKYDGEVLPVDFEANATNLGAWVPGYESWWDVAVADVSTSEVVKAARKKYGQARKRERLFF